MSIVKLSNNGVKNATAFGSITGLGSMIFIKKLTASSSSTLSFVHGSGGVDFSTYKEYLFTFNNIHHQTINKYFSFNVSIDGGSNYNVAKTSTHFRAYHYESGSSATVEYVGGDDLAQGTGIQHIGQDIGINNDDSTSGYLHLFNPSGTVGVKHFIARTSNCVSTPTAQDAFTAGYINSTSAVDAVQFSVSSGNIDAGDICLYGIA
jgi:hypothetical protein